MQEMQKLQKRFTAVLSMVLSFMLVGCNVAPSQQENKPTEQTQQKELTTGALAATHEPSLVVSIWILPSRTLIRWALSLAIA